MSQAFVAPLFDIKAFAKAASTLSGRDALEKFERLREESQALVGADQWVEWSANGEWREDLSGHETMWLHLSASVTLSQVCQRCLGPAEVPVTVERSFRFVATEELAEAQDDESEEDVLVESREFDLKALIEDELLMAMPLVARHDVCPTQVKLVVEDPDFEAQSGQKQHPFAVLAKLQGGKSGT
jgi:uncharacterized protein